MEWLRPYYWAAALDAPTRLHDVVGWPGPPPREPIADDRCAELTALDLELIRIVYEVFVEPADCPICGAPLDGAINVDVTGGFSRLPGSSWLLAAGDGDGTVMWQTSSTGR